MSNEHSRKVPGTTVEQLTVTSISPVAIQDRSNRTTDYKEQLRFSRSDLKSPDWRGVVVKVCTVLLLDLCAVLVAST